MYSMQNSWHRADNMLVLLVYKRRKKKSTVKLRGFCPTHFNYKECVKFYLNFVAFRWVT
jgi:hypothetical protein